jgi:hypothetical protein
VNVKTFRVLVVPIAALALVAAGCGGDSSSESSADATETTVAAETTMTTEETTAAEETTDSSASASASASASSSSSSSGDLGLGGKCKEFAGVSQQLAASLSGQTADLQEASKIFDEIADQVPDEIKADYQVIADNFKKIADALKGVDLTSGKAPSPEVLAKLQELAKSMDSPKVKQATEHIQAWVTENC